MTAIPNLPRLLTCREAAAALGVAVGTLAVWRCTRRYPLAFVRIGRHVRYAEADVAAFIQAQRIEGKTSTTVGADNVRKKRAANPSS